MDITLFIFGCRKSVRHHFVGTIAIRGFWGWTEILIIVEIKVLGDFIPKFFAPKL